MAKKNARLEATLERIKRLEGLLPICMHCHKIRDPENAWHRLEQYISDHADVNFSHALCPACLEAAYPEDEDDDD
jgi:hypothetical protein